jgi:hypothetical protein
VARMAVDDSALRDPRIRRLARMLEERFGTDVRDWPDFAERYALGTLNHVWALPYDRVSPVVPHEDINETAKIDDFADAMVVAGLGENRVEGVLIKGAKKRIGYLERSEEHGRNGGLKSGESRRDVPSLLPSPRPQLALPPGEKPTKEKKPRKEKPPAASGHKETVDHFHRRFTERFGKGPTWNGKTGNIVSRLIKLHGGEEVRRRIDVLFDAPPAFLASSPPDVGTLSQHFDKLVIPAGRATAPRPPGSGRFEPRDGMDYEKPPWEK